MPARAGRPGFGPDTVLEGQEGHLFERRNRVVEQVCEGEIADALVARWAALIAAREARCRALGVRFLFLIAPEKHVVYADKLPPGLAVSAQRPARRILAALPEGVRGCVLYPDDRLRAMRRLGETYYRTDTHWTSFGAYGVAQALEEWLRGTGFALPERLVRREQRMVGDLGIRLTPERGETVLRVSDADATRVRSVFDSAVYDFGQVNVFETDRAGAPHGVLIRDSAGSELLPFLAAGFRRLVAVSARAMFSDLLQSEGADVVVTQVSERILGETEFRPEIGLGFPADDPPGGFAGFARVGLPLPGNRRQPS